MRGRALSLAVLFACGCGYTSQYSPPVDGRPRAVWQGDRVVVQGAGAVRMGECATAVSELSGNGRPAPLPPPSGYYAPRFYGPPIVVVSPGLAPPFPRPPLFFSPSLALARAATRPAVRGGTDLGSGARLDGQGLEKALVYLAVVALLVLPVVDTTLALAPAENGGKSAEAIDEVNAWNDMLRWTGSPCAPDLAPDPPASPSVVQ